jgi:putative ABC transport system permease protein
MITADIKIAFRNIIRNKVTSIICIIGLGIGMGSLILLQALIIHETTFDKFIPDYRNLYRVNFGQSCFTQYPLGEEMKKDFPEVKDFFRFNSTNGIILRNSRNELVYENNFGLADPSIFKIMGINLIAGLPASSPSEVAISENMAKKYFGTELPLGKVLLMKWINDYFDLIVTGVYKDFPSNSTLHPDFVSDLKLSEKMMASFQSGVFGIKDFKMALNWESNNYYTYVVLDKNTNKQLLLSKTQKYKDSLKDPKAKANIYSLQPVSETHLSSGTLERSDAYARTGNPSELKYYWSISLVILLISITNYVFLTRASTSGRLHEIGTKKVLGASQVKIRSQIIIESTLVTLLSLIPASFLIDPGISFINDTLNRTLNIDVFSKPLMWLVLTIIVISIGTLSGMFIGYNISRKPVLLLLTGKHSQKSHSGKWNYSFLFFHFSLYIILVICVLTVNKQIKYSTKNIKGLSTENIIISGLFSDALKSGFEAISNEIEKVPGVIKVAGAVTLPPSRTGISPFKLTPIESGEPNTFDCLIFGEGMASLLGMEFIDGCDFRSEESATDVIFNESAAKKFNIKVGDKYRENYKVAGIVKDFNAFSFHEAIGPMAIIQFNQRKMNRIAIKTDGKNDQAVLKKLRELYTQIDPNDIFRTRYFADSMSGIYKDEKNQVKIIGAFSILASALAIMGLFGIALISITRKRKEIGLRKVNGASISEILILINSDFVRWVFFSMIFAIPVSYYITTTWLKRFAYKTELSWWIFGIASLSAIFIAILTVSWQSWRAATRNPVEALRYE